VDDLREVRVLAEEDVIQFGEELARFSAGPDPDTGLRRDYETALDAYEYARRIVDRRMVVRELVDTLNEGRYALACAKARTTGSPLPRRRTPCFFNPQHGPSSTDVTWTPASGPTRKVPACSQDAARVQAGEDPPVRYGEVQVPTWEAGAPNEPYKIGFFSASPARAQVIELKSQLKGEGRGRWGIDFGRRKKPRLPYD
jgi:hypothetical protein